MNLYSNAQCFPGEWLPPTNHLWPVLEVGRKWWPSPQQLWQLSQWNGMTVGTDSPPTQLLVCDGYMWHLEPLLGTVTRPVFRPQLSSSKPQHGGQLLVPQLRQHGVFYRTTAVAMGPCYHAVDAAGTCDASSGTHILYTRPIRRKNFRRTARSSGIRSNCIISHR